MPENFPETIKRSDYCASISQLGLDPARVLSLHYEPSVFVAQVFDVDAEGKKILNADGSSYSKSTIRIYVA